MRKEPTQLEKIEVIQSLARGLAHEMNNILAIIMGLASAVESELESSNPMRPDIEGILAASKRGHELTRNLLGFAATDSDRRERLSLNQVVGTVGSLLQRALPAQVDLHLSLEADLDEVDGDPDQIKRALVNLADNGLEAMRSGGTLSLSTKNAVLDADALESHPDLAPGKYVRVQVADTGVGMESETLDHAFEPFFSTKEGTASGLGLSTVFTILTRHSGRVTVFSKRGLGTTVTMDLPVAEAVREEAEPAPRNRSLPHRSRGTALVVDDERMMRRTVKRLLGRLGYDAVLAAEGEEALEIFAEQREEISFVLLDLIMPLMDGAEVLQRLREIDPKLPVVVCSGYWKPEQVDELRQKGATGLLRKPFTLEQLADQIEDATAGR